MHIAIISDTHDNSPAVVWIIEYINSHAIPIALHAGDIINPGIIARFKEHYTGHLHFVFGNNDGERDGLKKMAEDATNLTCHGEEMKLNLEGRRIFMNHYSSISEAAATTGEYDICIGGHDHVYRVNPHGESLFINPGNTVSHDKWQRSEAEKQSSFVILDLETLKHERVIIP